MNNQLQAVLAELIKEMGQAASQYGPQAISLAGHYLQLNAILILVTNGIGIVAAIIFGFILYHLWTKKLSRIIQNENEKEFPSRNEGITFALPFGFCVLAGLNGILILAFFIHLITPAFWIAAMNPQLALVQHALQTVPSN